MDDLSTRYDKIVSERENLIEQILGLAKNETVKKYFELCKQNDELASQQNDLYKQIKIGEYSSCNHIWVNTLHYCDSWEGRSYNYNGCVKCGLDMRVFHLMENCRNLEWLTFDQRIMYDFMRNHSYKLGINTGLSCDLDLARAIYVKIKEAHPSIDDETAVKYLKVAVHNIRYNKVSDERKANRAKRLSLKPKFNRWSAFDIRK